MKRFWKGSSPISKFNVFPLLHFLENVYLLGLVPLFIYEQVVHRFLNLQTTLPFLPLMMTSVYCALGIVYSFCKLYVELISNVKIATKVQ